MACVGWLAVFVTVVLTFSQAKAGGVKDWYYRCCTKGEAKATGYNGDFGVCDKDDLDQRRFIVAMDRMICRIAERMCCMKKLQLLSCDRGQYDAFQGKTCARPHGHSGSDRFLKCCDCCSLGIKTSQESNLACDAVPINKDPLCKAVFTSCCNGQNITIQPGVHYTYPPPQPPVTTKPTPQVSAGCAGFKCEHICQEDRFKNPVCYCYNGFSIDGDGKSCLDVNECVRDPNLCRSENKKCVNTKGSYRCVATTVTPTPKQCSVGYALLQGVCKDIDECASGSTLCSSAKCENTAGSYRCVPCGSGYRLRNNNCEDVDECKERRYNCKRNEVCQNTQGSYRCVARGPSPCQSGYKRQQGRCVDIDECKEKRYSCNSNEECQNIPGSYRCVPLTLPCPTGYRRQQGRGCVDIDECRERSFNCRSDEVCQNIQGSYRCKACPSGFKREGYTSNCEDINECAERTHRCPSNQVCQNTKGSYTCVDRPGQACSRGYQRGRNGQCEDIDECLTANKCSPYASCTNVPGTYECRCKAGFRGDGKTCYPTQNRQCPRGFRRGSSGLCVDIDECAEGTHGCISGKTCQNTRGSYTCVNSRACPSGYNRASNGRCIDINECLYRVCPRDKTCENLPGSYQCNDQGKVDPCAGQRCPRGYECKAYNGRHRCEDINECSKNPCGSGATCKNTPGSYVCQCQKGYESNPFNPNSCQDINECIRSYPCQHDCKNAPGSYICTCRSGYELDSPNGRYCININECITQNPCQGKCRDTPGSFECSCDPGYRLNLDRRTCSEIDECAEGQGRQCAHGCTNTPGSFQCTCRSGWRLATNKIQCVDVNECTNDPNICGSSYVCVNTMGSYECVAFSCPPRSEVSSSLARYYAWDTPKRKCVKKQCAPSDTACYNIKDKAFNLWTFNLPVGSSPADLFTYRIIVQGYTETPVLKYRFRRGNEQNLFEIQGPASNNAKVFIRNRNILLKPGNYRLEFVGELFWPDGGKLVSRYVHYLYVYVYQP